LLTGSWFISSARRGEEESLHHGCCNFWSKIAAQSVMIMA
jgi:hypothetical protein